jgi:hypothetical protein
MRRPPLRLVLVVVVLAMTVVAVAAVVDHRWKQRTMDRLEVDAWYCHHTGARCGSKDPDNVERRWNEREVAYKASVAGLGGATAILLAIGARRRLRPGRRDAAANPPGS